MPIRAVSSPQRPLPAFSITTVSVLAWRQGPLGGQCVRRKTVKKCEEVYLKAYNSIAEARRELVRYFEFKGLTTAHRMRFAEACYHRSR
jgi:hypothetical protein